jgi:hypothetical protein
MNRPENVNDLQISWAIRDISSSVLSFPERGLLWYFLSVIGNNDYCFDDFPAISQKTGLSERCLRNYITKLEELKFIQVVRPERKGRGRANQYFLLYANLIEAAKLSTNKATDAVLPDLIGQQMPYLDPIIRQNLQDNKATDASYRYTCKKDIKAERGRKDRAHPLSPDFQHLEEHETLGIELNLTVDEFDYSVSMFKSKYLADGTKKKDWNQELNAWLMREAKYKHEKIAKTSSRLNDHGKGNGSARGQQEIRSTVPEWKPERMEGSYTPGLANQHISQILQKLKPNGIAK